MSVITSLHKSDSALLDVPQPAFRKVAGQKKVTWMRGGFICEVSDCQCRHSPGCSPPVLTFNIDSAAANPQSPCSQSLPDSCHCLLSLQLLRWCFCAVGGCVCVCSFFLLTSCAQPVSSLRWIDDNDSSSCYCFIAGRGQRWSSCCS